MNYFRAILFGIVAWMSVYVFLMTVVSFPVTLPATLITILIYYVFLISVLTFMTYLFYTKDQINGFALGGIILGVETVLNLAIAIPFYLKSNYLGFFIDWRVLVYMSLTLLVPGIYGLIKGMIDKNSIQKDVKKTPKQEEIKKGRINVQQSPSKITSLREKMDSFRQPLGTMVDSKSAIKFVTNSR